MFIKRFNLLIAIIFIAGIGYSVWRVVVTENVVDETNTSTAKELSSVAEQEVDAGVAFIRDGMLYLATRSNNEWTEVETGVPVHSVLVWNDDMIATGFHTERATTGAVPFYDVTVDIRDPENFSIISTWTKENIETYRVSRNGTQILYTDSDYDLYLYDVIDDETTLLDTGVHQLFDGGATYPLTWNEDLAQLTYTTFEVNNDSHVARGSFVYDLATNRKTLLAEIAGQPIEAFFEEDGKIWMYYTVVRDDIRESLRRFNITTLQDNNVVADDDAPSNVWVRNMTDPWFYQKFVRGHPYYSLVRVDGEIQEAIIDNVTKVNIRGNGELLVAIPKSSSMDNRLIVADAHGRNHVTISETMDTALFTQSFVWKTGDIE